MICLLLLLSVFIIHQSAAQCGEGDVRLVGGFLLEGSLEVCWMGDWRRVCTDEWESKDATVACRELGFSDQGSKTQSIPSTGPITLSRFQCSGNESRLTDCSYSNENCTTATEAGVQCRHKGRPIITALSFDRPTRTLTCTSIEGPATNIIWTKDGDLLNGTSYRQTQVIVDTGSAIYQNTLTIIKSDVDVSGTYTCTVSNSRGTSSTTLSVPICDNGDAEFDLETGKISQICFNGTYYNVILETETNFQNDGRNNGIEVPTLGALFGLSVLAIIILFVFLVLLICHKKHNQVQLNHDTPSCKPQLVELQSIEHEVENELYGTEYNHDVDYNENIQYNIAYLPSNDKTSRAAENFYEDCKANTVSKDGVYDTSNF